MSLKSLGRALKKTIVKMFGRPQLLRRRTSPVQLDTDSIWPEDSTSIRNSGILVTRTLSQETTLQANSVDDAERVGRTPQRRFLVIDAEAEFSVSGSPTGTALGIPPEHILDETSTELTALIQPIPLNFDGIFTTRVRTQSEVSPLSGAHISEAPDTPSRVPAQPVSRFSVSDSDSSGNTSDVPEETTEMLSRGTMLEVAPHGSTPPLSADVEALPLGRPPDTDGGNSDSDSTFREVAMARPDGPIQSTAPNEANPFINPLGLHPLGFDSLTIAADDGPELNPAQGNANNEYQEIEFDPGYANLLPICDHCGQRIRRFRSNSVG